MLKTRTCKVCKVVFELQGYKYFNKSRGHEQQRYSRSLTCSKICADTAKGAHRIPHGHCKATGCAYFGKLVTGLCGKHFQYFWRHGITEPVRRAPKALQISEGWKMWLAACIDCEGWIGLTQQKRATSIAYYGGVGVGNTNRILTDKLKSLTGLGYCLERPRKAPAKDMVQWMVTKREEVDDLLFTIRPYLLLKFEQADILLTLPTLHTKNNALRKTAKDRLTLLNRKGKK